MLSTYNRIRSPRFYQESMNTQTSWLTNSFACYLITDATCPDEAAWTPRVDSPRQLTSCCVVRAWHTKVEIRMHVVTLLESRSFYTDEDEMMIGASSFRRQYTAEREWMRFPEVRLYLSFFTLYNSPQLLILIKIF